MRRLGRRGLGVLLIGGAALACGSGASGDDAGGAGTAPNPDGGASAREPTAGDAGNGVTPAADAAPSHDASPADDGAPTACPAAAGKLTLYLIPPPSSLDWSTPNALLKSAAASTAAGNGLVSSKKAALGHEIGHANLELDCGDQSIPLTGQTGGGSEWQSGVDGFGVVFREYPGMLTEVPGKDHDDMVSDIQLRQASGLVTRVTFTVNAPMCARLKSFHDEYMAKTAQVHYSGLDRARRFEGAGCAIYAAAFVDVGGLLRRSLFTPPWSRTVFVGTARYANFLGKNAFYPYGSNTVARDAQGTSWVWPRGIDIPASTQTACVPGSATLDAWTGPEDTPFDIASLPAELKTKVPFSIYDPELMVDWAEGVWRDASAKGTASSLGATWTAGAAQAAHEITFDASCVMPQTIPFEADNDDLFKDSDAP